MKGKIISIEKIIRYALSVVLKVLKLEKSFSLIHSLYFQTFTSSTSIKAILLFLHIVSLNSKFINLLALKLLFKSTSVKLDSLI